MKIPRLIYTLIFVSFALGLVANVVAESPVESWDLSKFVEGQALRGTAGNTLTPKGVVTATEDGADFSNGGFFLASQNLASLTGPSFSVVCKVRKQAPATSYGTIFHSAATTIRLHDKVLKMGCNGEWHAIKADAYDMPLGEWVQVAGTMDGTVYRLYVDGQLLGEWSAVSPMRTEGDTTIGGRVPITEVAEGIKAFESFPGLIRSIQIFDHPLSPEALQALP